MKITLIIGSHRQHSESARVGDYLEQQLRILGAETWTLDLGKTPLPLWDEALFDDEAAHWQVLAKIKSAVSTSDGFLVITPEWHGMAPSGLKNFFMLWGGTGELAHKPALLCSISSTDGGAYAIAELRMSSYKNNRICYIPEQLVIRNVGSVFNAEISKNNPNAHEYFVARSAYCLKLLLGYANALKDLRCESCTELKPYPNGM